MDRLKLVKTDVVQVGAKHEHPIAYNVYTGLAFASVLACATPVLMLAALVYHQSKKGSHHER